MRLTGERWHRAQALFDTAVDLPPAARGRYLDDACGGDAELRADVERLLAADDAAEGFLGDDTRDRVLDFAATAPREGLRIGPYRVVRELGRGGMGSVYLAERVDDVYAGRVAIKFVHGTYPDADLRRRFRSERQILADLRHPGIPPLLDGGTTQDGTPYLVMEYVEGEAITDYAKRLGLSVRDRLDLFLAVCDAVAHAHRSLIVHRDIKPSNVLVDRDGRIRLVDFGVAKPLGPDHTAEATAVFRRLTPAHAAPEQLRAERITVATDVWALGVLLYELLTGVQPFLADTTVATQHRVLNETPAPPSAVARQAGVPALSRGMAAALDPVILRALQKEPAGRQASVERLADEVRRAAAGPVHRWRIAAGIAIGLALGAAGGTFLLARASRMTSVEREARVTAEHRADVLRGTLGTIGALPALDRAASALTTGGLDTPERVRELTDIAAAYAGLGDRSTAASLLATALEAATQIGGESPLAADVLDAIADIHLEGDRAAGQSAALDALAIRETDTDPLALARTLARVAAYRLDRDPAAALALIDRAARLNDHADPTLDQRLNALREEATRNAPTP